ncbi:hypothetical protein STSP2_03138 [Anaerohalosphaera lusitana]|uniref:Uncharacterized protein n=2 Tax=Anaerohalosphaera lusitana TaxID=1936003 RepID=A0A1U9NQD6_9BACT|nr:hypothetical protein STSP2_03138 [Anaerohalosphaera lusitana]
MVGGELGYFVKRCGVDGYQIPVFFVVRGEELAARIFWHPAAGDYALTTKEDMSMTRETLARCLEIMNTQSLRIMRRKSERLQKNYLLKRQSEKAKRRDKDGE